MLSAVSEDARKASNTEDKRDLNRFAGKRTSILNWQA